MNKPVKLADKPHRLEKPLTELMRNHRRRIDGVASGSLQLGEQELREMAKTVGVMHDLVEEQERQQQPVLTTADWLARAELQIFELRRLAARGGVDALTMQRSIEAAMGQLVAARAAVGEGRRG